MEPTQIKTRKRRSLPIAVGAASPVPYQRAPTLMAGAAAGRQGQVRVWGPRKRTLWMMVGAFPVVVGFALTLGVLLQSLFVSLECIIPCSVLLFLAIGSLYRPCYVTTDDAGIAVTTWTGSRALCWEEISEVTRSETGSLRLRVEADCSDCVEINLLGYPMRVCQDLKALLIERAGLLRSPDAGERYVRECDLPLRTGGYISLGVSLGRTSDGRVALLALAPGSPAGAAGLLPGDEILTINDQPASVLIPESENAELPWQPGAEITVAVRRTVDDHLETIYRRVMTRSFLDRGGHPMSFPTPPASAGILLARGPDRQLIAARRGVSYEAMEAGVQPGDAILDINGFDTETISIDQAYAELTGPYDSTVTLIVKSGSETSAPLRSVTLNLT